jgi:hypothetical protein
MRVRVVKKTSAYWNYGIQTLEPPQEVDGEFARHLADNAPAGDVEVIDDDREEAREAAAQAAELAKIKEPAVPEDPDGDGHSEDDGGGAGGDGGSDPAVPEDPDAPPVDGTIDTLMVWIGGDSDRALRALEAEQAKDKPRSTVVKRLSAMTGAESE